MKTEATSTKIKKRAVLEALEKSLGVVTIACKNAQIHRDTFYTWKKEDKEFAKSVEDIEQISLDFAEASLHAQIKEKNTSATIFFLKTKGRSRGYIERKEVDVFSSDQAKERDLRILDRYNMLDENEQHLLNSGQD